PSACRQRSIQGVTSATSSGWTRMVSTSLAASRLRPRRTRRSTISSGGASPTMSAAIAIASSIRSRSAARAIFSCSARAALTTMLKRWKLASTRASNSLWSSARAWARASWRTCSRRASISASARARISSMLRRAASSSFSIGSGVRYSGRACTGAGGSLFPMMCRGPVSCAQLRTRRVCLDKDFTSARDDDLLLLFEPADDRDNALLSVFDGADARRAGDLDLLTQHLAGTLRHVRVNVFLQIVPGALERQGQVLHLDLAQDALDRAAVQVDVDLEGEHQLADFLGDLGVLILQPVEDLALGGAVDRGEHFDQVLRAADRRVFLRDDRGHAHLQDFLDALDDLRRGAVHRGDAHRHVHLELVREVGHHLGGLGGRQVREHQGDRLRLLALQEIGELARVRLAQELERLGRDGHAD